VSRFDIAVIGGGFAGLCAALHSLRLRPDTTVAVIDARALPGDVHRRGLGESTSELAAWYLARRLGLRSHLESEQVVKFGLRFWLSRRGGDRSIDERVEWGPMGWPVGAPRSRDLPLEPHAYQLHRGRLEHAVAHAVAEAGGELWGEHRLVGLHATGDLHELELQGPTGSASLRARWVIDASGDGAPSRMRGEVDEHVFDHRIAAAWWWVEGRVDPSSWSEDPEVHARSPPELRVRSTHHFVGDGTWAWLIPLADGSTSVGLVADAKAHPKLDAFEREHLGPHLRAWLDRLEPQLASRLRELPRSPIQAARPRSRAMLRPLRPGWLVTGSALAFLDPLYSSGHDLTALIHELAIPVIVDDLEGQDINSTLAQVDRTFANVVDHFATTYRDWATTLADPVVASLKLGWDQMVYFGWLCTLGLAGRLGDAELARASLPLADRVHRLNERVADLLHRWATARRHSPRSSALGRSFVDQGSVPVVMDRFLALEPIARGGLERAAILAALHTSVDRLEQVALGMLERVCIDRGESFPGEPLDPYGIAFDRARWAAEGLFRPRRARRLEPEVQRDLAVLALTGEP